MTHLMQRMIAPVLLVVPTILFAQDAGLTDAEVNAAINAAKQQHFQSLFVEAHGRFLADFSVILQGPVGRTMDFAREAFESYKPLSASDVPDEITANEVTFTLLTHRAAAAGIKNVVIIPPGASSRDVAIQPLPPRRRPLTGLIWRETLPRTWKAGFGSESSRFPAFYRFAETALPPGDLQIVVATGTGEQRYTVMEKERDRIR